MAEQELDSVEGQELEGQEGGTPRDKKLDEIAQQLGTVQQSVEQNASLGRLLQNPLIRQVLEAEQSGKKLKLVDESQAQVQDVDLPENVDQLSQGDLVKLLFKKVDASVQKGLASGTQPIIQRLEAHEQALVSVETDKTKSQIDNVLKTFPDARKYGKVMLQLSAQHPSLGPEELYWMAKVKAGDLSDPRKQSRVESERPTSTSARPPSKVTRKEPLPKGRAGFQKLLGEALAAQNFEIDEE